MAFLWYHLCLKEGFWNQKASVSVLNSEDKSKGLECVFLKVCVERNENVFLLFDGM